MINIPYEEQLQRKQVFVEECIGSFGSVETILRMKNPDHYRNKVTSVFAEGTGPFPAKRRGQNAAGRAEQGGSSRGGRQAKRGRGIICGMYEKDSHRVVPVEKCLLEDVRADAVIQSVLSLMPSFRIAPYNEDTGTGLLRYVQVRTARATRQLMVTLVTADPVFPSRNNFVAALRKLHPEITTIVQNINDRTDSMVLGERERVLFGKGYIEDRLCGKTFRISSRSFYQVNALQTEKLYHIAIDYAGLSGKETVLDAYCGIGTIGICASDSAKEVIGIELNREAVRDAAVNSAQNADGRSKVVICQGDAAELAEEFAGEGRQVDVLFMDPPRAGSTERFMEAACRLSPKKIVYISCNPETLGRDLAFFTAHGYRMKKAQPVDMFPATPGVETVVLLSRSNG